MLHSTRNIALFLNHILANINGKNMNAYMFAWVFTKYILPVAKMTY